MIFQLLRKPEIGEYTDGYFFLDSRFYGYSLELPWRANLHDISCIPIGLYDVQVMLSEHFTARLGHEVFLPHILNVPGRLGIDIHGGNHASDSLGCVLLASNYDGPGAISGSLSNDLTLRMGKEIHKLEILQAQGS